jgi:hypothetical protein
MEAAVSVGTFSVFLSTGSNEGDLEEGAGCSPWGNPTGMGTNSV